MGKLSRVVLVMMAGCGSVGGGSAKEDAGVAAADAKLPADASVDAPPPPQLPPTPAREIVSGTATMTSATFRFDVELGHPVGQQSATGATYRAEGNAAIKP